MTLLRPISAAVLALTASISAQANVTRDAVVENYTNIAHAVYEDSLITAKTMQAKIQQFIAKPSPQSLADAKSAWLAARVPYQQSEVYRFGNANVDDWEGQVNAWPLDEGLIDYTSTDYEYEMGNIGAQANIVKNTQMTVGNEVIDLSVITPDLLASLNEVAGSEANVASGYHAIEFLLWGQDLNGTKSGSGNRPYTDYVVGSECTGGNCERRVEYLQTATTLLISDLQDMTNQWSMADDSYASELRNGDSLDAITKMFFGMGSLAFGELAGQRMNVALEANSTEDEHDCFSDNTHNSNYYDAKGIENIYLGRYERVDGTVVSGASLSELVDAKDASLNTELINAIKATDTSMWKMVTVAEAKDGQKFDQMIAEGNTEGNALVVAGIDDLKKETALIEKAALAVGVSQLNPTSLDSDF